MSDVNKNDTPYSDDYLYGDKLIAALETMEASDDSKQIDEIIEADAYESDVKTLSKAYREINDGETLPPEYTSYANPNYISPTWSHTTCDVIYKLEQINWKRLTLEGQKAFFSAASQAAKNNKEEYFKFYAEYIFAIIYQTVWAYANRMHGLKTVLNKEDIVQGALDHIVTDTKQIAQYDPQYAPSTFIKIIAQTAVNSEYYIATGENKVQGRTKKDLDEIYKWLTYWGDNGQKMPTWVFYWCIEMSRAQPRSFGDIDDIVHHTGVTIMHDNLISAKNVADEKKNPDYTVIDGMETSPLYKLIEKLLNTEQIIALQWYVDVYMTCKTQTERAKFNKDKRLSIIKPVIARLQNNQSVRALSTEANKRRGLTELSLGKARIPQHEVDEVGYGEIEDHIELA